MPIEQDFGGIIARLEAASGPDRRLDSDIEALVQPDSMPTPHFTGSVDAAVTLIPKNMHWEVKSSIPGCADDFCEACCSSWNEDFTISEDTSEATGTTPAIALCIAALRAIAWIRRGPQEASG